MALGKAVEAGRDGAQHLVARLAPMPLVEQLEVLDIQVGGIEALVGMRFDQFVGLLVERGGVVEAGEPVALAQLPYLGGFDVLVAVAHFGIDVGDEAHDHRLAALSALDGHDGLRHPAPAAIAAQFAELIAQRAARLLDAREHGSEVPEPLEPLAVLGAYHILPHVVEHSVELAGERRHDVLARLVVEYPVRAVRQVDLEQLVVGRGLPQRGEQAAAPVVNGPAREQHAGAAVEPVNLEAGDLEPLVAPRAEDDGLGGIPVPVPGAVDAGLARAAERLVAEGANLAARERAMGGLVHVHHAIVAVDDIGVPAHGWVP